MVQYCKQIVFAESVHMDLKPLFSETARRYDPPSFGIFSCHFYDFCKIDYENEKYETNPFMFIIQMETAYCCKEEMPSMRTVRCFSIWRFGGLGHSPTSRSALRPLCGRIAAVVWLEIARDPACN